MQLGHPETTFVLPVADALPPRQNWKETDLKASQSDEETWREVEGNESCYTQMRKYTLDEGVFLCKGQELYRFSTTEWVL